MFLNIDGIAKLQMTDRVGKPTLAKTFPMTNVNIACAEHIPHGHFICTSIGGGDNPHEVIVGNAKHALGFINGEFESIFAKFGSMGATESCGGEVGDGVARMFFAWS